MISFYKMSEKEMILLSSSLAILLTENLNVDEQNTLGNFLMTVGQNIILGAGQRTVRENDKNNENNKIDKDEKNKIKGR